MLNKFNIFCSGFVATDHANKGSPSRVSISISNMSTSNVLFKYFITFSPICGRFGNRDIFRTGGERCV